MIFEKAVNGKERPVKTVQELFKDCQKNKDIQSKLAGVFD